jgi:hypothetical protein
MWKALFCLSLGVCCPVSHAGDEKNLTPALGAGVMTMTSAGTGTPVTPADGTATVMPEHERHALRKQSFRSAGAWGITCTLAHHVHSSSGVCSVTAMCLFVRMSSSSDLSHFALRVRVLHTHTHTHNRCNSKCLELGACPSSSPDDKTSNAGRKTQGSDCSPRSCAGSRRPLEDNGKGGVLFHIFACRLSHRGVRSAEYYYR